jgi:hypothetical protein
MTLVDSTVITTAHPLTLSSATEVTAEVSEERIAALAAEARDFHLAAERAIGEAVRLGTEGGKRLLRLKDMIRAAYGHGHWTRWLQDNRERLGFSKRTAQYYMALAGLPEAKAQRVAEMSLRQAVKALSERQPQPKLAAPPLDPHIATLVDTAIALAGADVVAAYIGQLKEANAVSLAQFEQAARWAKRQLRGGD